MQRRNAINAQLTNVRQMLATLSGAAPAASVDDPFEVADEEADEESDEEAPAPKK